MRTPFGGGGLIPPYVLITRQRPIHVVLAYDPSTRTDIVVTAYEPDPELWNDDFKSRNKP